MNKSATLKFSLISSLKQVAPFYYGFIALFILMLVIDNIGTSSGSLGSWDLMAIFVAIAVPAGFQERFHFFLQNGYSRKSIFLNFLITFVIIAVGMSLMEVIMVIVANLLEVSYQPMYQSLYTNGFELYDFTIVWQSFLWHATSFLAMMGISFAGFITFYKTSKTLRYFIFLIVPMLLIIGIPIIDVALFDGTIVTNTFIFIVKVMGLYNQSNPFIAMGTFLIIFMIGIIISYILIRKTNIRK